jgi:hypothetical protein
MGLAVRAAYYDEQGETAGAYIFPLLCLCVCVCMPVCVPACVVRDDAFFHRGDAGVGVGVASCLIA